MTWPARTGVSAAWRRLTPIIWARDAGTCQWPLYFGVCGAVGYQVDHRVPRAEGGHDTVDNGWVLCRRHHNRKTAKEAARGRARAAAQRQRRQP